MRNFCRSISIIVVVAAAQLAAVNAKDSRYQDSSQLPPQITSARLKGNKLIVTGQNFSEGAVIFVEDEPVATRTDPDGTLVAKKAGKRIPPETVVSISVMNNTGVKSRTFDLFSGLVITFDDNRTSFHLAVGDQFQLVLKKDNYEWSAPVFSEPLVAPVMNAPLLPDSQGVFQATMAGSTQLWSAGDLPCAKLSPPCLVPTLVFNVTLVIE